MVTSPREFESLQKLKVWRTENTKLHAEMCYDDLSDGIPNSKVDFKRHDYSTLLEIETFLNIDKTNYTYYDFATGYIKNKLVSNGQSTDKRSEQIKNLPVSKQKFLHRQLIRLGGTPPPLEQPQKKRRSWLNFNKKHMPH